MAKKTSNELDVTLKDCKEIYDKTDRGRTYAEIAAELGITAKEARRRGRRWETRLRRAVRGGRADGKATILEWKDGYAVIACIVNWKQVIFICPFCKKIHSHGWDHDNYDDVEHPLDPNTWRVAHCGPYKDVEGYHLRVVDDPVVAGF